MEGGNWCANIEKEANLGSFRISLLYINILGGLLTNEWGGRRISLFGE